MFSSFNIKAICAITSLCLIFSLLVLPTAASIKPNYADYEYGEAYKSSNYYDQLIEAKSKLTGDNRYDVILIALSQIGYHEGNSDADMDGWNLGGSENYVEYNRLFSKLEGIWGYAWCAAFVSWCQYQAGVPADIDCSEVSCPRMINEILKPQGLYKTRESGYTPIIGDLIYFKNKTSTAVSTHVGLVIGVRDGYVYTVEGNGGEKVARHKYALDDSYIVGYGALKYETKEGTDYSEFSLEEDSANPGKFIVTADSLNVRAGSGTSFAILGTLKHGDEVEVLKFNENWGKINWSGKEGWVSASYLRSTETNVYTIYYNVGEGKMKLTQQRKFPGTEVLLTDEIPTLEGNTFIGWATEKGGPAVYTAGQTYSLEADLKLYAVWDPVILTVTFTDYDGSILGTAEYSYGSKVESPKDIKPERKSDGELAYEFAGWDEKLTWYIKRDMTYTATYTARELTAEEKAQYIAAQATEAATEAPTESGCGASTAIAPLFAFLLPAAIIFKRKK